MEKSIKQIILNGAKSLNKNVLSATAFKINSFEFLKFVRKQLGSYILDKEIADIAYKLSSFAGNVQNIARLILSFKKTSEQDLFEELKSLKVPLISKKWNKEAWFELYIKDKKAAEFLPYADKIENLSLNLKHISNEEVENLSIDTVESNFVYLKYPFLKLKQNFLESIKFQKQELQKELQSKEQPNYKNAIRIQNKLQKSDLIINYSILCAKLDISEASFMLGIDLILSRDIDYKSILPKVFIDGEEIGHKDYYLTSLKETDPRFLLIGKYTDSEQYIGGEEEDILIGSFNNPAFGIYAIFKKGGAYFKGDNDDIIIAHSIAYLSRGRGKDKNYAFLNSFERSDKEADKLMEAFYNRLAENLNVEKVIIGMGGDIPQENFFLFNTYHLHSDILEVENDYTYLIKDKEFSCKHKLVTLFKALKCRAIKSNNLNFERIYEEFSKVIKDLNSTMKTSAYIKFMLLSLSNRSIPSKKLESVIVEYITKLNNVQLKLLCFKSIWHERKSILKQALKVALLKIQSIEFKKHLIKLCIMKKNYRFVNAILHSFKNENDINECLLFVLTSDLGEFKCTTLIEKRECLNNIVELSSYEVLIAALLKLKDSYEKGMLLLLVILKIKGNEFIELFEKKFNVKIRNIFELNVYLASVYILECLEYVIGDIEKVFLITEFLDEGDDSSVSDQNIEAVCASLIETMDDPSLLLRPAADFKSLALKVVGHKNFKKDIIKSFNESKLLDIGLYALENSNNNIENIKVFNKIVQSISANARKRLYIDLLKEQSKLPAVLKKLIPIELQFKALNTAINTKNKTTIGSIIR